MFRKKKKPVLSIVIAFYNMEREAPRTLYTLSTSYQRGIDESDYEVVAVDCGSDTPLSETMIQSFGKQFRLIRMPPNPSPAVSINKAAKSSRGELVMVCIDGARMLSPGILMLTIASFRAFENPVTATLSMHLGPGIQRETMLEGYNSAVEDQLLESVNWRDNGYELMKISSIAESSQNGWFRPLHESNSVTVRKDKFDQLGGLDERFRSPGGGLVNLDYYKRAVESCTESIVLLGESTFHQIHGGVATNSRIQNVIHSFLEEYQNIRQMPFKPTERSPLTFGVISPEASLILSKSAEKFLGWDHSNVNNE
jgi:glycosyltransferase involved in cell wall biosynthesis